MTIEYWVLSVITAASAFTSLGFSIVAVKTSTSIAQTNAFYALARSVSFALISIVPFAYHHRDWLIVASTGMIVVQLLDGFIGIKANDTLKTIGPIVTAIINALALAWFIN